jgi:hypothetical protein
VWLEVVAGLRLGNLVHDRRLVAVVGMGALAGSCRTAARRVHTLDGLAFLAFGEGCHVLGVLERCLCAARVSVALEEAGSSGEQVEMGGEGRAVEMRCTRERMGSGKGTYVSRGAVDDLARIDRAVV